MVFCDPGARAQDVAEVAAVVRNAVTFPSPVLAVGALHSVTRCIQADQGTIVCMAGFNRVIGLADAHDSSFQARPAGRT